MKDIAAIVAPAVDVDRLAREFDAEHIAMRDADSKAEKHEKAGKTARDEAARRRLNMGRILVEARKAWPARGPKAKGWGEFLAARGISQPSALEWMKLAGYVEVSLPEENGKEIPSRREVAAARRETQPETVDEDDEPNDDWAKEVESRRQPVPMPTLDIDRELARLQNKLCSFAEAVPASERKFIAHGLRETARLIEEMK